SLNMTNAPTATADIARRQVTLGGAFTASDKTYDGTTTATIADASNLTLVGLVAGEDLDLTGLTAAFADRNAAADKVVHLETSSLADGITGVASNYILNLGGAPTASASIVPALLTISTSNVTK